MKTPIFRKLKVPVFKNALIYTATDGISKSISFFLLPIISRYLVPEQLGVVANFDVLQNILMLLAGQAIVNAIPYFYYHKSREQVALLISNLLLLIIFLNIAFSIFIIISTDIISEYLHINLGLQLLTIVSVITSLLSNLNLTLYRLENKPYSFSKLQILHTLLYIALTFLFVVWLRLEALGRIYSIVIAFSLMAILHASLLIKRRYIITKINLPIIKELAAFGIPLLPHSLSFWFKSGMDKILLTAFCGLSVNGLYSMAMNFGAIYSLFYNAFSNAFVPYLQKRISLINDENRTNEKCNIVKLSYKIGGMFILIYIVIVPVCWFLINYVLDESYKKSFQFVPYIIGAATINAFYGLFVQYPYTVKKTFGLGIITFSCSIVQLLLTYMFVRAWNSDGIKVSLIIGSLLTTLSVWIYSNKVYPLPWFSFKKFSSEKHKYVRKS